MRSFPRLPETQLRNMSSVISKMEITAREGKRIRRKWDVKTESVNPADYLKKLKIRDPELGNYIGTDCPQMETDH